MPAIWIVFRWNGEGPLLEIVWNTSAMLMQKTRTARAASGLDAMAAPLSALGWNRLETDWWSQS